MRKILFYTILAIFSFVMFGIIEAVAAEKAFKIGVDSPLTGHAAKMGAEIKGTVELFLEKVNYKLNDYKIEVVWIDDQADAAKATNAYAEAVERGGIQAGFFNLNSAVSVALMDLTAKYKIPHFFATGAAALVNEKYHSNASKYSYWGGKGWPVPTKLITGYVDCLKNAIDKGIFKPEKKRAAITMDDNDWGRTLGPGFKKLFSAMGWEISSEDYVPSGQTDFYPLMNKYKNSGVSVIAASIWSPPMSAAFIKQRDEVGVKAIMIADSLSYAGDWYKLTGPASNYTLDMLPQFATPQTKEWAKAFEAKNGYMPSPAAGLACDGMGFYFKIFRRAIEKYKELNSETIHRVMIEEVNTGKLTYGSKDGAMFMKNYRYTTETFPDPVVAKDDYYFPVVQYVNGKGTIVYPDHWKGSDFMVPDYMKK